MAIDLPFARHVARDLVAHKRKVYCLDWDRNGKRLATGSNDQYVRVWSIDSRHKEKQEKADTEFKHSERVVCVLWNPTHADGLVTSAYERQIRLWDTRSGKSSTKIGTPGINYYVAWSSFDANVIATGSDSNIVSFIDLRKNKVLRSIKNNQLVNELAFTQDGQLFLQSTDSGVEVYRYPEHEKIAVLNGHTGTVHTLAIDATDRYVVSGGADGVAAVWDLDSFACTRTCTHMDGEVKTLGISHDSQHIAYAGEQEAIFIESLQEGRKPWQVPLAKPPRNVDSLAWNPRHPMLAMTGTFSESPSHGFGNIIIYAPL